MSRSQIREERRRRSQSRKNRRRTVLVSAGFILALVLILGITIGPGLASRLRSNPSITINTGGPVALDPDAGQTQIAVGQTGTGYKTYPPTSGQQYASASVPLDSGGTVSAPANWGQYETALPDEVLVSNLEYGGIELLYDCPEGCPDVLQGLKDFIPASAPTFYLLAPYPGLVQNTGHRIAVTSWRHHLLLDNVDQTQIQAFIDAYINRGPKSVAAS